MAFWVVLPCCHRASCGEFPALPTRLPRQVPVCSPWEEASPRTSRCAPWVGGADRASKLLPLLFLFPQDYFYPRYLGKFTSLLLEL